MTYFVELYDADTDCATVLAVCDTLPEAAHMSAWYAAQQRPSRHWQYRVATERVGTRYIVPPMLDYFAAERARKGYTPLAEEAA